VVVWPKKPQWIGNGKSGACVGIIRLPHDKTTLLTGIAPKIDWQRW